MEGTKRILIASERKEEYGGMWELGMWFAFQVNVTILLLLLLEQHLQNLKAVPNHRYNGIIFGNGSTYLLCYC